MGGGALALLASCSQDELPFDGNKDGMVTFVASLPTDISTRSFGDGNTAVNLQCVVYNQDKSQVLLEEYKTFTNRSVEFSLPLVTGETYQILFYADAFGAEATDKPYTFNHDDGSFKVEYSKLTTNDDSFDAFFTYEKDLKVSDNMPKKEVKLTRPFAQLNIATGDLVEAKKSKIEPGYATIELGPVYSQLNLFTGVLSGIDDNAKVTYAEHAIVAGETISISGKDTKYDNLAMVYVLAPEDGAMLNTVDLTLREKDETKALTEPVKKYTSIPYKRNFRTNIVGNLLTANTEWQVVIIPGFTGDTWTGDTDEPTVDATDENVFHISTAAQLAGLAEMVNTQGENDFSLLGKTFVLDNDIDLTGTPWTAIGKDANHPFRASFDGNGHTIYNLNCTSDEYAGLFGFIHNAIDEKRGPVDGTFIKNIKVVNAKVSGAHFVGVIAANIATRMNAEVTGNSVENAEVIGYVTQIRGELEDANKIGGMFGMMTLNSVNVSNNTVKNVKIIAGRDAGGLTGCASHTNENNGKQITQFNGNVIDGIQFTKLPIQRSGNFGGLIGQIGFSSTQGNIGENTVNNITYYVEPWNGETEEFYTAYKDDSSYLITTAGQFAMLAERVNKGESFAGKTIKLNNDLDLNGLLWTPIGLNPDSNKKFYGTFDGNGYTISNLKINRDESYEGAGLFGALNGTLKNLTIKNAEVSKVVPGESDCGIAIAVGSLYQSGTIENVKVIGGKVNTNHYGAAIVGYSYGNVKNCYVENVDIVCVPNAEGSSYDNGDKAGLLIGYQGEEAHEITNNVVKGGSVTAYRDLGGLIGCAGNNQTISGNTVSDVKIICDKKTNDYGKKDENAGELIGRNADKYPNAGEATNVTIEIIK